MMGNVLRPWPLDLVNLDFSQQLLASVNRLDAYINKYKRCIMVSNTISRAALLLPSYAAAANCGFGSLTYRCGWILLVCFTDSHQETPQQQQ
jgi:hypothetical protein